MTEKKLGRRSKYDPNYHPKKAEEILKKGCTKAAVAQAFGVHHSTILDWQDKHSEFSEAIKEGQKVADDAVVSALYKSACGFVGGDGKEFAPNVTSAIFWLKNRNPNRWRDKREVVSEVKVSELSEEEIMDRIKELLGDD